MQIHKFIIIWSKCFMYWFIFSPVYIPASVHFLLHLLVHNVSQTLITSQLVRFFFPSFVLVFQEQKLKKIIFQIFSHLHLTFVCASVMIRGSVWCFSVPALFLLHPASTLWGRALSPHLHFSTCCPSAALSRTVLKISIAICFSLVVSYLRMVSNQAS